MRINPYMSLYYYTVIPYLYKISYIPLIFIVLMFIIFLTSIKSKKTLFKHLIIKLIIYGILMFFSTLELLLISNENSLDNIFLIFTYSQPMIISLFLLSIYNVTELLSKIELFLVGLLTVMTTYLSYLMFQSFLSVHIEFIIILLIKIPIIWMIILFYFFHLGTNQSNEYYFSCGKVLRLGYLRFISYFIVAISILLLPFIKEKIVLDIILGIDILLVSINEILFEFKQYAS